MLDLDGWESDYMAVCGRSKVSAVDRTSLDTTHPEGGPEGLRSLLVDAHASVSRDIENFRASISDIEALSYFDTGSDISSRMEDAKKGLKIAIDRFLEIEKILKRHNLRRMPNTGELVERKDGVAEVEIESGEEGEINVEGEVEGDN